MWDNRLLLKGKDYYMHSLMFDFQYKKIWLARQER